MSLASIHTHLQSLFKTKVWRVQQRECAKGTAFSEEEGNFFEKAVHTPALVRE